MKVRSALAVFERSIAVFVLSVSTAGCFLIEPAPQDGEQLESHKIFGSNFGYRCEDEDGVSSGSNIANDGQCMSVYEATTLASEACDTAHPQTGKLMQLKSITNWEACSISTSGGKFGSNFGYRCEVEDGVSSGSNIANDGKCMSVYEAVTLAIDACDTAHPQTGKLMQLKSITNWEACSISTSGGKFGSNFGYRCEDEDGVSSGSNIANDGKCMSIYEAATLAIDACDTAHPQTGKLMHLKSITNWEKYDLKH